MLNGPDILRITLFNILTLSEFNIFQILIQNPVIVDFILNSRGRQNTSKYLSPGNLNGLTFKAVPCYNLQFVKS